MEDLQNEGARNVMARFLPLMDLSVLLLGFFMIILTAAKFGKGVIVISPEHPSVMLYAACTNEGGRKVGELYYMDRDYNLGTKIIRKDTPEDIMNLIKEALPKKRDPKDVFICIMTEKYAWDKDIPRDICEKLKKSWGLPRIYRVKNVDMPETPGTVEGK